MNEATLPELKSSLLAAIKAIQDLPYVSLNVDTNVLWAAEKELTRLLGAVTLKEMKQTIGNENEQKT